MLLLRHQAEGLADFSALGDCFELPVPPQRVRAKGRALNLDPLLAADPSFLLQDFYPQFLDAFLDEGQLWGLPAQGLPRVMYYDKALFDAAGLAYPSSGWTLNDFFTLAAQLTLGKGSDKQG